MKNPPTADRFSTKILKDLKSNRNKLIAIETSNEPFTHLIDPLLARDRQLSEMLVDCLIHELDLKKDEVKNEEICFSFSFLICTRCLFSY